MEALPGRPGTAYLREFELKNQCELLFNLNVELPKIGVLQEEVRAVRRSTDTVESLLQHIVNKIEHSIKKLKKQDQIKSDDEVQVNISLKNALIQKPIKSKMILKNLINSKMTNVEFEIFDQRYMVVINAPLVKEIKLPQVLYANYEVQPSRLYILFGDKNSSKFIWFKSKDKATWTKVGNTSRYKPSDEDVDHYIKLVCVPCCSVLTGPATEVVSDCKVVEMGDLPMCPFEKRHEFTTTQLTDNCFRFVSYNILSNRYVDNEQFSYCPPRFLAIDYRKQLIAKELSGYNSDIFCLQEVDNFAYNSYYKDLFKNKNYQSFYHKKGNKIPEGLACFFNKTRFKKVDEHQIIFSQEYSYKKNHYKYLRTIIESNTLLKDCFMKQMTSLQITVLNTKISNKNVFVIVANTHLYYHPDAELVRVLQTSMATTYLSLLHKGYSKDGNTVRVILCGDFNSVPTSTVYEFLTKGKLSRDNQVFEKI
ncbi:2',5'-phosphodiesterase 12-like isoform X2 [Tribolium madens]|uniref:2',5'-phosphodiesterase 12-like isoform X2 n=1 Tax=Tribolium madens TaxID=41895 RepID=UPI001CF74A69|nr:2',5'-phosphodiesterase 12-like isoform X2 [Tribolium madens]